VWIRARDRSCVWRKDAAIAHELQRQLAVGQQQVGAGLVALIDHPLCGTEVVDLLDRDGSIGQPLEQAIDRGKVGTVAARVDHELLHARASRPCPAWASLAW